ncbi:uncharacterized protein TEOVI_000008800 [Trypanosoma equiperdum]|uniref:Present in the outer mitochondrial membrane proteome 8 n=3 Tax=Trypanozoon TaxID=39700 RepID=Q38DA9_TRYB2|nr:hypothetical protein, conserved [Trypanosoma brucei gambiense DAL972]XP_827541.1 hypothetical protein, conserved [Trypanosoma brucei brucei TREU927]EAN77211.1 hypothetical protein, conserved [Trypanosoma brucei brucei TREU927]CBH14736.1 hypothetical protein, conserved [Trypanosoma brucei gambiense DAL972]SCU64356.1 hypothetical protein, conserved [Trypanosoma equiperdum]|eukprot:XP_011777002.1 hypothetical protein, conserved [Trypanosoma brucei gambiense DAL972]
MTDLDATKISIISVKKANPKLLAEVGDEANELPVTVKEKRAHEKRCNFCCMSIGLLFSAFMVVMVASIGTGMAVYTEKRARYTVNGVMRQVGWISLPGLLVGTTLHYFLSEAMWSGRRNSWGQAWMKAFATNTAIWSVAIGTGTLLWRKGLLINAAGRRLYYRYPIPSDPLEYRLVRSEAQFFTGMGWSYWLSGVVSGQVGLVSCVGFCVWNDRPYFMMNPHGGYARRCMPNWRREQLARQANVSLSE